MFYWTRPVYKQGYKFFSRKTYSPVCKLVKFSNKKQANPKLCDVISQTMVYHLLYHVLSNSALIMKAPSMRLSAGVAGLAACLILACLHVHLSLAHAQAASACSLQRTTQPSIRVCNIAIFLCCLP